MHAVCSCLHEIVVSHKFKQDYEDVMQKNVPGKSKKASGCFICNTKLAELFDVKQNPANFDQLINRFCSVIEDRRGFKELQICIDCIFYLHIWNKMRSAIYERVHLNVDDTDVLASPNRKRQSSPRKAKVLTNLKSIKAKGPKKADWNSNIVQDKKFFEQIPYVFLSKSDENGRTGDSPKIGERKKAAPVTTPRPTRSARRGQTMTPADLPSSSPASKKKALKRKAIEPAIPPISSKRALNKLASSPISPKGEVNKPISPESKSSEPVKSPVGKRVSKPTPKAKAISESSKNIQRTAVTESPKKSLKASSKTIVKRSPRNAAKVSPKKKSQKKPVRASLRGAAKLPQIKIKLSKTFNPNKTAKAKSVLKKVDVTCIVCDKHFDSMALYKSHTLWHEKPEDVTVRLVRVKVPEENKDSVDESNNVAVAG